ncbi:unnamed protein product [Dicrocoelium dendriticum]|nr:unnamed protein product [Dicrocoelium dendriticum]
MGGTTSSLCAHVETKNQQEPVETVTPTKPLETVSSTKSERRGDVESVSKQASQTEVVNVEEERRDDAMGICCPHQWEQADVRIEDKPECVQPNDQESLLDSSETTEIRDYGETNQHAYEGHDLGHPIWKLFPEDLDQRHQSVSSYETNKQSSHIADDYDRLPYDVKETNDNYGVNSAEGRTGDLKGNFVDNDLSEPNDLSSTAPESPRSNAEMFQSIAKQRENLPCSSADINFGALQQRNMLNTIVHPGQPDGRIHCHSAHGYGTKKSSHFTRPASSGGEQNDVRPRFMDLHSPVKLPEVSDVIPLVQSTVEVRPPPHKHSIPELDGHQQNAYPRDKLNDRNRSLLDLGPYTQVDQPEERLREGHVIVINETADSETSMYACAGGPSDDPLSVIGEIVERTYTTDTKDDTETNQKIDEIKLDPTGGKHFESDERQTGKRSTSLSLVTINKPEVEVTLTMEEIAASVNNLTRHSLTEEGDPPRSLFSEGDATNYLATLNQPRSVFGYTPKSLQHTVASNSDLYVCNGVHQQTETPLVIGKKEETKGTQDEPCNIDISWEGAICTPNLDEHVIRKLEESVVQMSKVGLVYTAKKQRVWGTNSEPQSPDTMHDDVQQRKSVYTAGSIQGKIALIGSQTCSPAPPEKVALGVTKYLRVLQSADDFDVLAAEGESNQSMSEYNVLHQVQKQSSLPCVVVDTPENEDRVSVSSDGCTSSPQFGSTSQNTNDPHSNNVPVKVI